MLHTVTIGGHSFILYAVFEFYHSSGLLKVRSKLVPPRRLADNMVKSDSYYLKEESIDELDPFHAV